MKLANRVIHVFENMVSYRDEQFKKLQEIMNDLNLPEKLVKADPNPEFKYNNFDLYWSITMAGDATSIGKRNITKGKRAKNTFISIIISYPLYDENNKRHPYAGSTVYRLKINDPKSGNDIKDKFEKLLRDKKLEPV